MDDIEAVYKFCEVKSILLGLTLPLGSTREPKPQIELILEVKSAITFILGNPIAAYLAKNAICGQVRRHYEN